MSTGPVVTVVFFVALGVIAYLYFSLRKQAIRLQTERDSLVQEKKIMFDFLHDMGETVSTESAGQGKFLDIVLRCAVRTMGAQSGAIFLLDDPRKHLTAVVVEGAFPPPHPLPQTTTSAKVASKSRFLGQAIKAEPLALGDGIIGSVAQSGQPVLITDGAADSRVPTHTDPSWRIETMMAVPLRLRNETLGVMAIVNKNAPTPFSEAELSVFTSLADQATLALFHSRFYQLQQEKTRMDRDLQIARDIQTLLLPPGPPNVTGFDIAAINVPASHVGGDYYDFYPIDENRVGIGTADVSGKGVPGALMMVMCRSVTRSKASSSRSASSVLKEVNRLLAGDMKADMFITMSYAILDAAQRSITLARAGHEPALLLRAATRQVEPVIPKGMALGIDNGEHFDLAIEETTVALAPNDVLVLYTDGITEAMDAQGQEFGRDQFQEALRVAADGSSRDILANVCERIKRFTGAHPQHDDMTLVVIKAT